MTDVKTNSLRAWLLAARPKTLTAALAPVVIASSLAYSDGRMVVWSALACLAFAGLMQIASNLINDLYDFLRGTDGDDRLGPERACQRGWISPRAMRRGIWLTITAACCAGLTLLACGGMELMAVGAACVVFAYLYTLVFSRMGLGDVLVLVFFGLVPVCGSYYVQAGEVSRTAVLCGCSIGVVTDLLLIVNNYRDRDTDRNCGKRTLVALWGERFGNRFYLASGLAGVALSSLLAFDGRWTAALLPWLFVPLHVMTWRRMTAIREGRALNAVLGQTSRNIMVYAALLSAGLLLD